MKIFEEGLRSLLANSMRPIKSKAIEAALLSIEEESLAAKADSIVLHWWGTYGKEPTDSKSYRDLVAEVMNAFHSFFNKEIECNFEVAIGTLEEYRKAINYRLKTISDPKKVSQHLSEKVELDRQLKEINSAIAVLSR